MRMKTVYTLTMDSPIGILRICATDGGLTTVYHENQQEALTRTVGWTTSVDHSHLSRTRQQLGEYFEGNRKTFDISLAPEGTDFQLRVWEELRNIPYGETISYAELATRIGNPAASRAVGAANGRNPLSIIVPCHRVIGKNGSLTGYAGGLDKKSILLAIEGAVPQTLAGFPG